MFDSSFLPPFIDSAADDGQSELRDIDFAVPLLLL
jgi:hypothetical protein